MDLAKVDNESHLFTENDFQLQVKFKAFYNDNSNCSLHYGDEDSLHDEF